MMSSPARMWRRVTRISTPSIRMMSLIWTLFRLLTMARSLIPRPSRLPIQPSRVSPPITPLIRIRASCSCRFLIAPDISRRGIRQVVRPLVPQAYREARRLARGAFIPRAAFIRQAPVMADSARPVTPAPVPKPWRQDHRIRPRNPLISAPSHEQGQQIHRPVSRSAEPDFSGLP